MSTERLPHRRTKGPVSTPAQRLIELQGALSNTERLLREADAKIGVLENRLARFESLSGVSFGGIKMAQIWADLYMWEGLLNDNPQLKAVFELGTWEGGFSWWLWAQCQARGMLFHTFDSVVPEREMPRATFAKVDVFAEAEDLAEWIRREEPCVVLCDNGNKPRELATFAPELRHPDSLLVVHEWGEEIGPEDVPDSVEMVYGDFCDQIHSMSRVFRPRRADALLHP